MFIINYTSNKTNHRIYIPDNYPIVNRTLSNPNPSPLNPPPHPLTTHQPPSQPNPSLFRRESAGLRVIALRHGGVRGVVPVAAGGLAAAVAGVQARVALVALEVVVRVLARVPRAPVLAALVPHVPLVQVRRLWDRGGEAG